MKILVTGANGYIGRHVIKHLLDANHVVVACDKAFSDIDDRAIKLDANLFDIAAEELYENAGRPEVCLHLAWRNGFVHNDDSHILDISAHYALLTGLARMGVRRIAVMSSMHEVGYHEGMIGEDTNCNPMSLYGVAKYSLRQALQLFCKHENITLQWLRGYYIVGDDQHNHSIFTKLCQAEKEGKNTFPFTTGKCQYDFIGIEELSEQIAAVVAQDKVNGVIECCSGKPQSLASKVEDYICQHGFKIRLDYGAFPDRPYDSPITYGDSRKIQCIMNQL